MRYRAPTFKQFKAVWGKAKGTVIQFVTVTSLFLLPRNANIHSHSGLVVSIGSTMGSPIRVRFYTEHQRPTVLSIFKMKTNPPPPSWRVLKQIRNKNHPVCVSETGAVSSTEERLSELRLKNSTLGCLLTAASYEFEPRSAQLFSSPKLARFKANQT